MKILLKPFEVLGTAWKYQNDFTRARWKLTVLYTGFILCLFTLFAGGIYGSVENFFLESTADFNQNWEQHTKLQTLNGSVTILQWQNQPNNLLSREYYLNFQNEIRNYFIEIFFIWCGVMVLLSGFVSYILAGKTLAPIEAKMQQKNDFLADISHEIKNPLSALQTSTEIALQHPKWDAKEQKSFLEDFLNEIKRLSKLTEDLLFLQKNQTPIENFEVIKFQTIVKESIRRIAPLAKEKQIKIQTNIAQKNLTVRGIEKELEKLCFNLLHNAIKFSPPKSTLKLSLFEKINHVILEVKDAGPGISKADQEQIFDRFFKADRSRNFDYQGAGLGLSIVRKIIRTHQGRIKVKSQPGGGTTFMVSFPKGEIL